MPKLNNILDNHKVTVEEMKQYYAEHFPFQPNNQRVGRFAKQAGFRLEKQMINRKIISFYVKNTIG